MEPWWPQRVTNKFQRMQTNQDIHESVAAVTAEVTVLEGRRFRVVKKQNKTHISVAFKEDFSPVVCILCCDVLPRLPIESQLLHTAERSSLSYIHSLHAAA